MAHTADDYSAFMQNQKNQAELNRRVEPLNEMVHSLTLSGIQQAMAGLETRWHKPVQHRVDVLTLFVRCAGQGVMLYSAVCAVEGRHVPKQVRLSDEQVIERFGTRPLIGRYDVESVLDGIVRENVTSSMGDLWARFCEEATDPRGGATVDFEGEVNELAHLCRKLIEFAYLMALIICEEE